MNRLALIALLALAPAAQACDGVTLTFFLDEEWGPLAPDTMIVINDTPPGGEPRGFRAFYRVQKATFERGKWVVEVTPPVAPPDGTGIKYLLQVGEP